MTSYKPFTSLTVGACRLLQRWTLHLHSSFSGTVRRFSGSRSRNTPIIGADLDTSRETVKVHFDNNVVHEYPWLFLQDNCTCGDCFHTSSRSRKRLMTNLDLEKRVTFAHVIDGDKIKCTWSDGHVGVFSESWLQERSFTDENINKRQTYPRDNPQFTTSIENVLRVDFKEVLRDSSKLLDLLKALCTQGVVYAENAPTAVGQLRKLTEKVGFIRTSHYGNEFTVKSEANASNLAYTSTTLCVHTDLPYYVYPPGVQLLHCIRQSGGDDGAYSHLVDGFLVADQMKKLHPESYKILSEVPVEFADVGQDYTKFDKVHHSPTFVRSEKGLLTRIVYSNQQLSSVLPVPLEKVKPMYEALKLFTILCYDPKNLIRFKLKEGDILIFDNWRMLHGREGFDPSKGSRHLEGCYVDWDEVYSTMRVIQNSSQ